MPHITVLPSFQGRGLHINKASVIYHQLTHTDNLLVSIGADACGLVVLGAVHVGAVVEGAVPPPYGSPPALVEKMPIKARKGSVLRALVLKEQRALLCPELLQVSATGQKGKHRSGSRFFKTKKYIYIRWKTKQTNGRKTGRKQEPQEKVSQHHGLKLCCYRCSILFILGHQRKRRMHGARYAHIWT